MRRNSSPCARWMRAALAAIALGGGSGVFAGELLVFNLRDLQVTPTSGGGTVYTGGGVAVLGSDASRRGTMDVVAGIGISDLPYSALIVTRMALTGGAGAGRDLLIIKAIYANGAEEALAASRVGEVQVEQTAELHIVGNAGVLTLSGRVQQPLLPPLTLSHAFRHTATATDVNFGTAVLRYRRTPSEWHQSTGFGTTLRLGTTVAVGFATAGLSGSFDLLRPDGADGLTHRVVVGCVAGSGGTAWCPAAGGGAWSGFGGAAQPLPIGGLGLSPADFAAASGIDVNRQPPPPCPADAVPGRVTGVDMVAFDATATIGRRLFAGWDEAECADGYRVELLDGGGRTMASQDVPKSSLGWDLLAGIEGVPESVRIAALRHGSFGAARLGESTIQRLRYVDPATYPFPFE